MSTQYKLVLCLLGINLMTFLVFGLDKALAVGKKRRVPEATLLSLCVLAGSVGAMFAMTLFRHKTDARAHPAFVWGVPVIFLLQLAAGGYLIRGL